MNRSILQVVPSGANVASFSSMPVARTRLTVTEEPAIWRSNVMHRLEELVRLEAGWDGYSGVPVTFENACFALRMLEAICRENTPSPQIVPGASGDLQLEWHTLDGDVELLVRGPNSVRGWHLGADTDTDGIEVELTTDFTNVAEWVKVITEPEIAARAAA